jgi:hypothetical protein
VKKIFLFSILFSIAISSQAIGTTINFGDNANNWPGWGTPPENSVDTIGVPDFTGGYVIVEGDLLTSITFYYTGSTTSGWSLLEPGDLFIDVGADQTWDWVIQPVGNIYNLTSNPSYIITGNDNVGPWAGYNIRNNHPFAAILTDETLDGTAYFSGWQTLTSANQPLYSTFNGFSIDIGSDPFIIGWTVNCANDVVYETVNPVPEPATIFLLGSGLLGVGITLRKRFPKPKN